MPKGQAPQKAKSDNVFSRWQTRRFAWGIRYPFEYFLIATVGLGLADCLNAQEKDQLRITLDLSIRPETVHVYYFLTGEFGGDGDFRDQTKASAEGVFLPIYRKGQRATSVKAMVYAEGCEFVTFVLDPLQQDAGPWQFECHKLPSVWFKGVVTGYPNPSELRVRLSYLANWSHTVFGISDGMVPSLAIADVVPDRDGGFAVKVPDFANDAVTKSFKDQAEWSIIAWKTGTGDQYWLNTNAQNSKVPGALPIRSEYPEKLLFTAQHF